MSEAKDIWPERIDECLKVIGSFEYFLDEYVHIEDKNTNQVIKLNLWPEQRAQVPLLLSSQLLISLKAHQLGFTWIFVGAYVLWLSITNPLHQVVVNSFNEDVGVEIMKRIRFIRERLPAWLHPSVGTDNNLVMEFLHKDAKGVDTPSVIQVIPATEKGGQSKTPNVMIFDESCWNRYVARAYDSSLPGIMQAKGKIFIISNAIKSAPGWAFTRGIYTGSMQGHNDFVRIFLPWWANPSRSRKIIEGIMDDNGNPMTEFKQQMLRSGGTDGGVMTQEDFEQRYPETEDEAISTLLGSYFGKTLARHDKPCKGIAGNLIRNKEGELEFVPDRRGILEVWRFPYYLVRGWDGQHWQRRYCGGADVSEGLGQTYSVGYMMDRHLDEMACRIRSNRVDAHTWAQLMHDLSEWYCNATEWTRLGGVTQRKAYLCVERTGAGQTTVKRLKELKANQYVRSIPGKVAGELTKEFGWHESQQSKYDLCEDLRTWFKSMKGTLYDTILIDECSTWIKHEGTLKLGPEEGHFGDCVIAAGCTLQASHFTGKGPARIKPPDVGWMARQIEEKQEKTGWMV
jgi:hypothetical protein